MTQANKLITASMMAALVTAGLLSFVGAQAVAPAKDVRIGIAKTFFTDQPKSVAEVAVSDFDLVLKKTTGLQGRLNNKLSAFEVAAKLDAKELDFGIFFAHEFGWVQKKHPELQPLLIAVNKGFVERAYLIVHKNNPGKTVADLAGKKIDVPVGTIEPCRLFLGKICIEQAQKTPEALFGSIEKSSAQMGALDNVARQQVHATVVDAGFLELYKDVKPAVYEKNLRVLQESVVFPSPVIAYKKGGVADSVLNSFRDGLLKAHTIPEGRDMMRGWKIDVFEATPKDYAKSVADLLKVFPAPDSPR